MPNTLTFICVNYNNSNFTKLFLESLFLHQKEQDNINVVAIVVDNASNSDDYKNLQSNCAQYSQVRLIRSEINLGYFGGLNVGLANLSPSIDYHVVVGNNDLTFSDDFVLKLSNADYAEDILVVAPNVITADGFPQNPHCVTRVSAFRKFLYDIYFSNFWCSRLLTFTSSKIKAIKGRRSNNLSSISQFIHMGIGACYILTPAFFKHYSRLDGSVFLYGEEALLAGQVMSVNGRTFYDAGLIVDHAESATLSKLPSRTTYNFGKNSYPHYRKYL